MKSQTLKKHILNQAEVRSVRERIICSHCAVIFRAELLLWGEGFYMELRFLSPEEIPETRKGSPHLGFLH